MTENIWLGLKGNQSIDVYGQRTLRYLDEFRFAYLPSDTIKLDTYKSAFISSSINSKIVLSSRYGL